MVSREYWGESLPESMRVVKRKQVLKSLFQAFRYNSGERHFALSERLEQAKR